MDDPRRGGKGAETGDNSFLKAPGGGGGQVETKKKVIQVPGNRHQERSHHRGWTIGKQGGARRTKEAFCGKKGSRIVSGRAEGMKKLSLESDKFEE